jgi:hypothetical protein
MTGSTRLNTLEYKIKASILLKQLRSSDPEKAVNAALRFQRLPHLTRLSPQEIVQRKDGIRLKHALTVIAIENDQPSWPDLKHHIERQEKRETIKRNRTETLLHPRRCWGFLNEWYARYEAARARLEQAGGYLLPYKSHFFICTREYIEVLGLDPDDRDWEAIGWDWVNPADRDAWERLTSRLQAIELSKAR